MTLQNAYDIGGSSFSRTRRVDPEQRRQVILNAKERIMGVDKTKLDERVAQKAERKAREERIDHAYAKQAVYYDNVVCQKVQEALQKQRVAKTQLVAFHQEHQRKEDTREWDLNRKDVLKIEPPLGSVESTLTAASLQKFAGEDDSAAERRAMQIKQQRAWINMQKEEKQAKKDLEVADMDAYARLLKRQQAVQANSEAHLMQSRSQLQVDIAQVNKTLAAEKLAREQAFKENEATLNENEINAVIASPFANEDPILGMHATKPGRVRTDHWKGMADEDLVKIREFQATQRVEREAATKVAEAEENKIATSVNVARKYVNAAAMSFEQTKEAKRYENAEFLKKQMEEKEERDQYLREVYTNPPTDAFFNQFGTSHR